MVIECINQTNTFRFNSEPHNFKDFEEYRSEIVAKLVELTNYFVGSILENVYAFPKSIAWIVFHISKIFDKSFGLREASYLNVMIDMLIIIDRFRPML